MSYLKASADNGAVFYGHLDTSTLGGAGFASQYSPELQGVEKPSSNITEQFLDLSQYDGLLLKYRKADGKRYTFNIKDEAREEKRSDGREKANLSWEFEFEGEREGGEAWAAWQDFQPTYRGKKQNNTRKLNPGEIRQVGLMMRRYVDIPTL